MEEEIDIIEQINNLWMPFEVKKDLAPLIENVADSKYMLLGEASHGTHEFYAWRAEITKQLIKDKGFKFIAVEGDWPDCFTVNEYIKGHTETRDLKIFLRDTFKRWPNWMWGNEEIQELVQWLKKYNKNLPEDQKVGFYGLDVYSLWDSLRAVMHYLEKNYPEAVNTAREAYICFEPFQEEIENYSKVTAFVPDSCQDEAINLLVKLRQEVQKKAPRGKRAGEEIFNAEQNSLIVKNAEEYYRSMLAADANSWNIRDTHMFETLERLMEFYGPSSKAIVWAHNTHIGDARATDMGRSGMINLGQLLKEKHNGDAMIVGFSTFEGTVIAANAWGAPMEKMEIPPALEGSWEHILHEAGSFNKLLILKELDDKEEFLVERGQRAIGVVYDPLYESENYVPTVLPRRYDIFCYIDKTESLRPFKPLPDYEEVPETFPSSV